MFGKLPYYTLGFILFIVCSAPDSAKGIEVFEYGIHVEGEESSFAMTGIIPAMTQIYTVNATPPQPGFQNKLTFVKVEYDSPMTPVEIKFNPVTSVIVFYIRFPFIDIPFGIVGYSLKLFCVNLNTVNKAVTTVCDRAVPPQVKFTVDDEYIYVWNHGSKVQLHSTKTYESPPPKAKF